MTKASDLFIECLEAEGCEYVFGIPGEENLDFLDSLSRSKKIKLILTRHEQGAGFMASVYGRLTGKTGVCVCNAWPRCNQLHDGSGLRSAWRHAYDDDHRSKTCEKIQTRSVPDSGRCRDDEADYEIRSLARSWR